MTFIDDFSRNVWVYVLKNKNEALEKFNKWAAPMENQTNKKTNRLRTNNGLEYYSCEFEKFCKVRGIARHRTITYTPQQNQLPERINKTLIKRVRCMLINANLFKSFWVEAVTTTLYLINRSPSSALNFKTTQKTWSGRPPDLSNLRIFRCLAYAHVKQGKPELRAIKGYFLGYLEGIKGYKLYLMKSQCYSQKWKMRLLLLSLRQQKVLDRRWSILIVKDY